MKAEALFWQQCTQAITDDGSIDAQRLMDLVIATYRVHESNYDEIERSLETLLRENHVLRGNMSALSQAFDGQKKLFEIILNNLPLGLSVFDADQRLTLSNTRFRQLFGLTQEDLTAGATIADLTAKMRGTESTKPGRRTERHSAATARSSSLRRREWLMDDGRIIQSMVTILSDGSNISIHADITEDRRAAERITYLAHHDPLTGLPNRIHFREQVDATLTERKPDEQIALVHLNLDRFKSINNTMGVSAGDKILQQVAERVRASAGSENTLARLGSDEFAILQTGKQQPWNVTALAEQIRRELSEPFFHGEKQVELSVSMGIAIAPEDGEETDILLKNAGVALSHAKADGRKRERFFASEMEAQMQLRHALEADLKTAVENEEFELHYQPLYDLSQRRICGFEALIRWNHPVRGRVPPMDFIPLAEEVGLVVDIGRWVLRRACNDAAQWPEGIKIAVNVSAIQFSSSDLTRDVSEALAAAALSPSRLELEITESVLMENLSEVLPILHALKERGIRISMDDFGTGYSSLSYLSSFPFDKIKIDKSFVNDIVDNKEAHAIMHAIILLGDALGMRVTVEGVETAAQLALLECEECDEIQGYHISPPRPARDVPHLLSLPPKSGGVTRLPKAKH
ncbi:MULTISPECIES: putative bifunctional diguanylate cyclase/phosphodiesterase [Rhizobium]|uniref:putative bifunctional diguanylate cyclase/phosphodiesterase n=1 Tax=Rhizobium TaxID=379 RepID=UPI000375BFF7|nr:EAL domain-containing protein [Rhizobium leguminosarum]MBY5780912.1 EAL domain-containing protein [Rhizobium leguminosarum]MBY5783447.1 EAL domain-containing protein [Rhizobium leguminosarum]MBY5788933.1 EAL domain-containing protein [Rhizobium leguminosarum]MBY5796760.1 EAL domain-containing protein [Rhizobium leguminosarum]TBZ13857.1 EAL domain-containing protein [Rhizobium leguminosarum bv. viciae]